MIHSEKKLVLAPSILEEYRAENVTNRLRIILEDLNEFFDHKQIYQGDIPDLSYWQVMKLRSHKIFVKLQKYSKKAK